MELITPKAHVKIHFTEEKANNARLRMQSIVRPLADVWHGSEAGIEWHKKHGKETWLIRESVQKVCEFCGSDFKTKLHHQTWCSNKCKSAERRKSGIDDVNIICEKCGTQFKGNKYAKLRFCSRKCGSGRRKS